MMLFGILALAMLFTVALVTFTPLYSHAFQLHMPVDCTLGENCYIQNYVDLNPEKGRLDYMCGHLSYDAHKGTDFRLINLAQMREGVDVLAVADGKVVGVRDEMPDVNFNDIPPAQIEGKECGNGLRMEHAKGYTSQYCHLKRGSVRVKVGQKIKAGEVLGEIGLSGHTEFPHLHLQIADKDGQIIDPFAGPMLNSKCGGFGENLWIASLRGSLAYQPNALLQGGFLPVVPTVDLIRNDPSSAGTITAKSDVIALWAEIIGPKKGDVLFMIIHPPEGKQLAYYDHVFESDKAVYFQFVGKKRTQEHWPSGTYKATVTLKRGKDIDAPVAFEKHYEVFIGDPSVDGE